MLHVSLSQGNPQFIHVMGVSKNRGTRVYTPKWMVYNGKPKTLLKWMIWGYPYFWKHPYGCSKNDSFRHTGLAPFHLQVSSSQSTDTRLEYSSELNKSEDLLGSKIRAVRKGSRLTQRTPRRLRSAFFLLVCSQLCKKRMSCQQFNSSGLHDCSTAPIADHHLTGRSKFSLPSLSKLHVRGSLCFRVKSPSHARNI